jgi:thiol:disulfide interchange protein
MFTFVHRLWLGFLLLLVVACSLKAQILAPTAVVSTAQVRAELLVHAPEGVAPGKPLYAGLWLKHQPEWHTYWLNAGDSGLATQLDWALPAGLSAGKVAWPLPHKIAVGNLTNYGYEGSTLLATPITVGSDFKPGSGPLSLQLKAQWLVCRQECIPQEGTFQLTLSPQTSHASSAALFEDVLRQQPQTLTGARHKASAVGHAMQVKVSGLPKMLQGEKLEVFPTQSDLLEASAERHPQAHQAWEGATWTAALPVSSMRVTQPAQFGLMLVHGQGAARSAWLAEVAVQGAWAEPAPVSPPAMVTAPPAAASDLGFGAALLGALLGGLILNLMPCVLPVLAIKVLSFARPHANPWVHRMAGMTYSLGVIASTLLLGAVVMGLRSAGDQLGWGFQLQSPWVVSGLCILFTLIALNLWDVFQVHLVLPSRLLSWESRHPAVDTLFSGVLTVAIATPCTAPFMGASIGLAIGLPVWQGLLIFAMLGLGLALPVLLISWFPALSKLLPRPGPWMNTLRHALAFPMLATVIWLLWVLGQQTDMHAVAALLGVLLLLAGLLWALALQHRGRLLLGILFGALLVWTLTQAFPLLSQATAPSPTPTSPSAERWQAWSEERVKAALAAGQPVFVDFTAAWCVTCQVNKRTTLANADVLADFDNRRVLLLRADWTRQDPVITRALSALGRSGVPVYVLYSPNRPAQVLSELISVSEVRQALQDLPLASR